MWYSRRVFSVLGIIVFTALIVACGGGTNNENQPAGPKSVYPPPAQGGNTATLVVYRKPHSFVPDSDYRIQLNDQLVGHIRLGKSVSIPFIPNKGKNSLVIVSSKATSQSSTLLFEAFPGGTYRFSCDTEVGVVRGTILLNREDSEGVQISDVSIALNQTPTSIEAEVENITVEKGVKSTLKRSRTIKHTVTITKNEEDYRSISGSLGTVKGVIQSKVGSTIGQNLNRTDTVERIHEFDGQQSGTYKITWVERYREGTATVAVGGVTHTIPFKICIGADLTVEKIK
jgi:hypothetical protein